MLVEDHLNLLGDNPLRGLSGNTFIDLVGMYQQDVYDNLLNRDTDHLTLHRGVLAAMPGPSYETPAEVRMLRLLGCDACGMSTIPEVVACRQMGVRVLGISLISNHAAGIATEPLTHAEVMQTAQRVAPEFVRLIQTVVPRIQAELQP